MRVKYKNVNNLGLVKVFVKNALEYLDIQWMHDCTIRISFFYGLGTDEAVCFGDIQDVEIRVNKEMPIMKQLRALSHELIHARQFLSGELSEDHTVWRDGKDYSKAEYLDQPWEVEAHEFEDELFMKSFPWDLNVKI